MATTKNRVDIPKLSNKVKPPTVVCQWCWRKVEGVPILKYFKYPPSKEMVYEFVFCGPRCIETCKENEYFEIEGDELEKFLYQQKIRAFFLRYFTRPEHAAHLKAFYSQL